MAGLIGKYKRTHINQVLDIFKTVVIGFAYTCDHN